MADILNFLTNAQLPHTVLPMAPICAVAGSLVLSRFTRWLGAWTLFINAAVLFVGAYSANVLLSGVYLPFNRFFERPLIVSTIGMTVVSVLLLMVSHRRRNQ